MADQGAIEMGFDAVCEVSQIQGIGLPPSMVDLLKVFYFAGADLVMKFVDEGVVDAKFSVIGCELIDEIRAEIDLFKKQLKEEPHVPT